MSGSTAAFSNKGAGHDPTAEANLSRASSSDGSEKKTGKKVKKVKKEKKEKKEEKKKATDDKGQSQVRCGHLVAWSGRDLRSVGFR